MEIEVLASGSTGNCYYITDGSTPILIECGIPWKKIQQGLNFKTSEIAGCLVTHEHLDHSKAVREVMRAGIDVYASQGTIDALGLSGHRIKAVREQFKIGSWTILPFGIEHDAAEPLGFLLASKCGEKLLFATDTFYVRYRFNALTHIIVECNYDIDVLIANVDAGLVPMALKSRLLKSHFSFENVKKFLMANDLSKVQEIWLIHLSHGNSDAEKMKREIMELTGKPVYIAGD